MMESGVGIGSRLFRIGRVFAFCRIDRAAAERFWWRTLVEVFREQELTGFWIAHEDTGCVVSLCVLYIRRHVGIARGRLFRECASETVNKIVGVDRIAVGPATGSSQMESELGRIVVYVPAFGECRIGLECFGIVFNEAFIKREV